MPYGGLAVPYWGLTMPYGGLTAPYGGLAAPCAGSCVALHRLGIGKVASIDKRARVFHRLNRSDSQCHLVDNFGTECRPHFEDL